MASFAFVVTIDGRTRGVIPSPSPRSLRSGRSFYPRVVSLPAAKDVGCGRNAVALTARAMAPAKYEDTHARERHLTEMREVCEGDVWSDRCKVAWDKVEVSRAKADLRLRLEKQDPLESFCEQKPETDECRVHED